MRSFQDHNFVEWNAFISTGRQGFANDPWVVFQSVSDPSLPPRRVEAAGDEATAQAMIVHASTDELRSLFDRSELLP
jgi:hypothetical protein